MGQKTNPIGLRLNINKGWDSVWFDEKNFSDKLHEDIRLRNYLKNRLKTASVSKIEISRTTKKIQRITPCIAYDATHGYSDQYLIEHNVFIKVLEKLSLNINLEHQSLFPNKEYPTISVNYIT